MRSIDDTPPDSPVRASGENVNQARSASPQASAELNSEVPAPKERSMPRSRSMRVLLVCMPIFVLVLAVAGAWLYEAYGLPASVAAWLQPSLVHATGQVFYAGEAIPGGVIQTAPLDGQPVGALGIIGQDGRFTLETQVEDRYVDGAYVGRHKLAVNYGRPRMMGVIPLVPEKYFTLKETDLTINVTKSADANHFELRLEGNLTEEAQRALGLLKDEGDGQQRPAGGGSSAPRGPPPPRGGNARPPAPADRDPQ